MNLISQSALAKLIGISRQATSKAVAQGTIPHHLENGKKKIDLDNPGVQIYIKENSVQREREQGKKKPSGKRAPKQPAIKKSSNIGKKNSAKSKSTPKIKVDKPPEIDEPSDLQETDTSAFDLNQREKLAKTKLAELRFANGEKKNLPTDFIEDALFRHIELLHSNVERYAGIKIKEICTQAIEDGEVSPKHVEKMVSEMLKIIYNTTKSIEKAIKKYEPKV